MTDSRGRRTGPVMDAGSKAELHAQTRRVADTRVAVLDDPPARIELRDATQVGRVTTVVVSCQVNRPLDDSGMAESREYVAAGASVCDQLDVLNPYLGLRLALGRAVVDLGHQIKHDAWRDVERHPHAERASMAMGHISDLLDELLDDEPIGRPARVGQIRRAKTVGERGKKLRKRERKARRKERRRRG